MIRLAAVLLLLMAAVPALAQDDCGDGLPCGPLPWDMPQLPQLESPTPMPTTSITLQPTLEPTSSNPNPPTVTPTATPPLSVATAVYDAGALLEATEIVLIDLAGTPVNISYPGAEVSTLFGYIRGINANFGVFQPLVVLLFAGLTITLFLKLTGFIVPIAALFLGLARKAITIILDFLPF